MAPQKRRNPWLAGLGNLLFAPLGHVYAGQAWRGMLMWAARLSITLVGLCAFSRIAGKAGLVLTAAVLIAAPLCLVADAAIVARQQGGVFQLKWYNRWYTYLVTAAMVWVATQAVTAAIRAFVVEAFYLPSSAMTPTLQIDDRIVVDKLAYRWHSPARFDVVVFRAPRKGITGVPVSAEEHVFIKRVIGLPGESVELREKKVYINGKGLDEAYVHFLLPPGDPSETHEVTSHDVRERYGPVTVPENHYFVMGDNRDNSQDSRYWGFLPRGYIKGKALVIYWSYEAGREDYQDQSAGATIRGFASVFVHFFTRTRWDRLLHQIR